VTARTGDVWHAYVPGIGSGQRYGYRLNGPWNPRAARWANEAKLLLDPWSKAIDGCYDADPSAISRVPDDRTSPDPRDSAPHVPRSVVIDPAFDWGDDTPPGIAMADSVIYETHGRGLTKRHPHVPDAQKGTYAGVASAPVIAHLQSLGVTAVELMPVHQFLPAATPVAPGLTDYWGYMSVGFFAPHGAYCSAGTRGQQVGEFKSHLLLRSACSTNGAVKDCIGWSTARMFILGVGESATHHNPPRLVLRRVHVDRRGRMKMTAERLRRPYRLAMFDLDGTLAVSKSEISAATVHMLRALLSAIDVCIISGGRFEQFDAQVLRHLGEFCDLKNLHLMPTCGTRYLRWEGGVWGEMYFEKLSSDEKDRAMQVLRDGAEKLGFWTNATWGPALEDRGSQVTYSALGQSAPADVKLAWDPDNSKKESLRKFAATDSRILSSKVAVRPRSM
jgi:hypothetical protein